MLGKASSYSEIMNRASKGEPLSSTRRMGLRWGFRSIFLAHVVDATDAVLPKHNQKS